MLQPLIVRKEYPNGVLMLTIDNHPYNVLTEEVFAQILEQIHLVQTDKSVRTIIFAGSGTRFFSSGSSIHEFPREKGQGADRARKRHAIYATIESLRQPTIAAINGDVYGGGLEFALACDFRIAVDEAKMGLTELRFGIFPAGGGVHRLVHLVGEAKAKELIFLSRVISAVDACKIGLVHRVANRERFWESTKELADSLANQPASALQAVKQVFHEGRKHGFDAGLEKEVELIDEVFLSRDVKEALAAFREKRNPVFHRS